MNKKIHSSLDLSTFVSNFREKVTKLLEIKNLSEWSAQTFKDRKIQSIGWHPFMWINQIGQFKPLGQDSWQPINSLVQQIGQFWKGQVTCFKTNSIECTLLARYDEGYTDACLILTDLQPEVADACWYSMRSWIECVFKDGKRGGFCWHQTKIIHPKRAERHWLAIA
ncbi:hypothetical protein NSTC731_05391 [Nostoc sp. DSM 114167]|jgi:hypothetical protein